MYAIEFEAVIEKGMIKIPQQYLSELQPRIKVIILQEESILKKDALKQKDEFLARVVEHRFDLPSDYCFNREELYDRI
jgi:hypothetical protein